MSTILVTLGCESTPTKSKSNNNESNDQQSKNEVNKNNSNENFNSKFEFTAEEIKILESFKPNLKSKQYEKELNNYLKNYIRLGLNLDSTLEFSTQIFFEKLDSDSLTDAVVTLNLLNLAKNKAFKSKNPAKIADVGFMGDYNYLLYFDGLSQKITCEKVIDSSPLAKLKVQFENITSNSYKDILVDYRILNASYRVYFSYSNKKFEKFFEWKNFDGLGNKENEAYYFEYDKGSLSERKDILVYLADLIQPTKGDFDKFTFIPKIKKTGKLSKRFFYHPKVGKYMTR